MQGAPTANLERFFGSLNQHIEEAGAFARQELARFCNELAPTRPRL